jgi:hypothetical protein
MLLSGGRCQSPNFEGPFGGREGGFSGGPTTILGYHDMRSFERQ